MDDPSLAQQLDTTWRDMFVEELKSGDLGSTQSGLTRAIAVLDKQDTTIGRLKLAFGASLVVILGLGGYIASSKESPKTEQISGQVEKAQIEKK